MSTKTLFLFIDVLRYCPNSAKDVEDELLPTLEELLAERFRSAWRGVRIRSMSLGGTCSCTGAFGALSSHDFEEALIFHVVEGRVAKIRQELPTTDLPDDIQLQHLEDVVDWVVDVVRKTSPADCCAILQELQQSIESFASQCSVHRFRAESA